MPHPPTHLPRLPKRAPESHKGDYGRALLVGGSLGMSGAIALAGMAALRSGAGLVTLAVPDVCLDTVASFEPSYMTVPLPSDDAGQMAPEAQATLQQLAMIPTCIACGPGLGRSVALTELVGWMYQIFQQPLVIDADGLNALAKHSAGLASPGGPRILTPHPGEFGRLVDDNQLPSSKRQSRAEQLAADHGIILVLKGHRTFITDGRTNTYNTTGNPGMATGGTGDVLTGIITALVCQGLTPLEAAQLGVYLHGLAGDMAADKLGQISLIASDLLRFLPEAMKTCS